MYVKSAILYTKRGIWQRSAKAGAENIKAVIWK